MVASGFVDEASINLEVHVHEYVAHSGCTRQFIRQLLGQDSDLQETFWDLPVFLPIENPAIAQEVSSDIWIATWSSRSHAACARGSPAKASASMAPKRPSRETN